MLISPHVRATCSGLGGWRCSAAPDIEVQDEETGAEDPQAPDTVKANPRAALVDHLSRRRRAHGRWAAKMHAQSVQDGNTA